MLYWCAYGWLIDDVRNTFTRNTKTLIFFKISALICFNYRIEYMYDVAFRNFFFVFAVRGL
jgi:hypothetical protein